MTLSEIRQLHPEYDIPQVPFSPIFSSIVVWRIPVKEQTVGGLYIPDTAKEPRQRGVLLSAGLIALDELESHGVKLGDIVVFAKYAGTDQTVKESAGEKGEQILILKAGDILGSEGLQKRIDDGYERIIALDDLHYVVANAEITTKPTRRDPRKG